MDKVTQYWAVIPATGTGQRMKASCPKQYIKLGSKTILQHTLDNLLSHPLICGAVLVLNSQDQYWEKINYKHEKTILVCAGGEQRVHSVYKGLLRLKQQVKGNPVVLIHDSVRPFVSHNELDRLLQALEKNEDGVLLATAVADTLKYVDDKNQVKNTHPRNNLWRAFTPQVFWLDKIELALKNAINNKLDITDDASAIELMGGSPLLVEGDGLNIKITTPQDLLLAEMIVNNLLLNS